MVDLHAYRLFRQYDTQARIAKYKADDIQDQMNQAQDSINFESMNLQETLNTGLADLNYKYASLIGNAQKLLQEGYRDNDQSKIDNARSSIARLEREQAAAEQQLRSSCQAKTRAMTKPIQYADAMLKSQFDFWDARYQTYTEQAKSNKSIWQQSIKQQS